MLRDALLALLIVLILCAVLFYSVSGLAYIALAFTATGLSLALVRRRPAA